MKTNWLWDSKLNNKDVIKILKDENHPKFNIYAEKLFSRISEPKVVFSFIDEIIFCKKWPSIKKRISKDRWLKNRIIFWQTIYERIKERLKTRGISIRESQEENISPERMKVAEQIRNIRRKNGYTQKDVAKKLGVIQQYISKIEGGHENVSIDTLKRIADVFNKSLDIRLR
ncbi:MAG: helix-turn-helix transcriptional regulator [Candidatus Firestonebacteria bacterium]